MTPIGTDTVSLTRMMGHLILIALLTTFSMAGYAQVDGGFPVRSHFLDKGMLKEADLPGPDYQTTWTEPRAPFWYGVECLAEADLDTGSACLKSQDSFDEACPFFRLKKFAPRYHPETKNMESLVPVELLVGDVSLEDQILTQDLFAMALKRASRNAKKEFPKKKVDEFLSSHKRFREEVVQMPNNVFGNIWAGLPPMSIFVGVGPDLVRSPVTATKRLVRFLNGKSKELENQGKKIFQFGVTTEINSIFFQKIPEAILEEISQDPLYLGKVTDLCEESEIVEQKSRSKAESVSSGTSDTTQNSIEIR